MKAMLTLILIFCFNQVVIAQPESLQNPSCKECDSIPHRYPLKVCDPNAAVATKTFCVSFPLDSAMKDTLKTKRFKKFPHNFCFKYERTSSPFGQFGDPLNFSPLIGYRGTQIFAIFNSADLYNENVAKNPILRAFQEWKKVCDGSVPTNETPCCSVLVRFAKTVEEMGEENINYWAITKSVNDGENSISPENGCTVYCGADTQNTARIMINALESFLEPEDFDGTFEGESVTKRIPTMFYLTDSLLRPNDTIAGFLPYNPNQIRFIDLYSVMLHEFGHILGFNHFNEECNNNDDSVQSVMTENLEENKRYELTWQDRCAYKRFYCCTYTSVYDIEENSFGQIPMLYPNPTTKDISLPFFFEHNSDYVIFSSIGEAVISGKIPEGTNGLSISVSSLPIGSYTIVIQNKKLIVRRFQKL